MCAPLLGRFKKEVLGEDKYVTIMVNVSKSGFKFQLQLEHLAVLLRAENKYHIAGPAFCHTDGSMFHSHQINSKFRQASLKVVQLEHPGLLPEEVGVEDLYRTF